jgi:hypothetical protein
VSSVSLATRRLGLKITTQACQEVIANAGFIPAPSRDTGTAIGRWMALCLYPRKQKAAVCALGGGISRYGGSTTLEHAWAWVTNGSLLGTFIQKFPGSSDLVPHVEYLARSRATPPRAGTYSEVVSFLYRPCEQSVCIFHSRDSPFPFRRNYCLAATPRPIAIADGEMWEIQLKAVRVHSIARRC